ncbi:MAG: ChaB family protein, partial [Psychrobacter alimentarius]
FNSASKQYDEESRWFATAWAAVENVYEKNADDKWVKKPDHK